MTFGERLEKCIKESPYNQKELAELIGITPVRLNYWVKDKRQPDVPFIKLLAKALNVSADYLIGNETSRPNLTPEALAVAEAYMKLDDIGRELIHAVIEIENKRNLGLPKSMKQVGTFRGVPMFDAKLDGTAEMKYAARKEQQEIEKEEVTT